MESRIPEYDKTGHIRERTGAILPKLAPSNIYPSADGMVLIAGNQDTVFARLCEAMGQPALAKDARYATHVARGERQAELDALIADRSEEHTSELQSLMRISYAVFCLKKKKTHKSTVKDTTIQNSTTH